VLIRERSVGDQAAVPVVLTVDLNRGKTWRHTSARVAIPM